MWRIQELKNTFILFNLFGQTAYIPLNNRNKKFLFIFSFAMKIFLAIATITSTILYFNSATENLSRYFGIFAYSSTVGTCIRMVVNSFSSRSLLECFAAIIKYLETKLHITINLSQLDRKYRRMIILAPLIHAIHLILKIASGKLYYNSISYMIFSISVTFKDITILHMTLYIELMGIVISSLNEKINKILLGECDDRDTVYLFRQFKWIHLKLLNIAKIFNDEFGWILFFTTLESFLQSILSSSFHISRMLENQPGFERFLLKLLRNYIFLF